MLDCATRPDAAPSCAPDAIRLRAPTAADARELGRIVYEAFKGITAAHGFPPDFPSQDGAEQFAAAFIAAPDVFGVVAEDAEGRILGSNFLTEGDPVRGVGPITVDPGAQAGGIGRRLMQAVLDRAEGVPSARLLQAAYNLRSMSLYASLGFEVKEPVVQMAGVPKGLAVPGRSVRPVTEADIPACAALCVTVHGVSRAHELRQAIGRFGPLLVEHEGRVTGYLTAPGFWIANHGVARTEADMLALLGGAAAGGSPLSMLVPTRQAALFRTLLAAGMRVVQPMTLMVRGTYQEPRGTWFPSVFY